jgi:hypothetical protein
MPFVQFRVHPSLGCARFGNSSKAYHLACEAPFFLQEQFPKLRFKPRPRNHPRTFFADAASASATGALGAYQIFNTRPDFQDRFKDDNRDIFPQAARFRVFAYVYPEDDSTEPSRVFEVTPDLATVRWKVNIANKKSVIGGVDPSPNMTAAPVELDTASALLECKRVRPIAGRPNLAYLFVERDEADKAKVTNRLHVIGNEGELQGSSNMASLWSDDWSDSAGDGSVEAVITLMSGGAPLRQRAGGGAAADFKYLSYDTEAEQPGTTTTVTAMPGWVVVGCPDYVPDMGHFVSLWDIGLGRALYAIDVAGVVVAQPGKHKHVTAKAETERYKCTDYYVHIHPQLCLFDDIKSVSGEAFGQPENQFANPQLPRAHNKHPPVAPPPPDPDKDKLLAKSVQQGGVKVEARARWGEYADPNNKLKDPDPGKPINDWLKIAIFKRLRKPSTLYKERKFLTVMPGAANATLEKYMFPRKLGRRLDYDGGPDQGKSYDFPNYGEHEGNLINFHGHPDAGKLCGGDASPPSPMAALSASEAALLPEMDDMYWPATFSDMPLLRELAYTPLQYDQFDAWQKPPQPRFTAIYPLVATPEFHLAVAGMANANHEAAFDLLVKADSKFVPALIDMAAMGAMLGGSFLPGIEVGREAGVFTNWSLFHGGTSFFPDVRFKQPNVPAAHTLGTLTKDLAVPWSKDFAACDEKFWPTSRPGVTTKDGVTRNLWLIDEGELATLLGAGAISEVEYVKKYWTELGFIRRTAGDQFVETEQRWH